MPGFSDEFRYYVPPDDEATKTAMISGLIVLDTNVLLGAYRFAPAARSELLSILERIADRLWIPNRVAEEFHRNRLQVIGDYDAAYLPVIEALQTLQENLLDELQPKISQLANRAALRDTERDKLLKLVTSNAEKALSLVEELRQAHGIASPKGKDEILTKFQQIFDGKTGGPFNDEAREQAVTEAARRTSLKLPPGYLDSKNPEPFGDYFVWQQTIIEVKRISASYLVFVTGDTKEDWYQKVKGKTVGARPELSKELLDAAGARLVMMSTTSFLFHAREHLDAQVSQETIRQSRALPSPVSEKLIQQNSRRRQKLRDLDRLTQRIDNRRALISALDKTISDRSRESNEDTSDELQALRKQLDEAKTSERILTRRRNNLLGESAGSDDFPVRDVGILIREISSIRENIFSLQDEIQERLSANPSDGSDEMVALQTALRGAKAEDERLMARLGEIQHEP
jgi:hypothetical protein